MGAPASRPDPVSGRLRAHVITVMYSSADERMVSLASRPRAMARPEGERVILAAIVDRRVELAPGVPPSHPATETTNKAFVDTGPACPAAICQGRTSSTTIMISGGDGTPERTTSRSLRSPVRCLGWALQFG